MFVIFYEYNGQEKTYQSENYHDAVRMYWSMLKHKTLYKNVKKNFQIPVWRMDELSDVLRFLRCETVEREEHKTVCSTPET